MTPRPAQPEPFVRGAPYPAAGDVPYPRANPTDTARLPSDTWHAAVVPAGVRLEVVGDAEAIDIAYRTTTGNLGYRGDGAGITFSVWRAGRKVCEEEAVLGDGLIRLSLGSAAPDKPATIYLPEGMQPVVLSLTAVQGGISPAPDLPRWIAYGDSITQGWMASGPAQGWAAIAARKAGLDLVNLGYAAAGRGEIVSAEHIATLPADIISIAYGASCWTRVPHSVGLVAEGFSAFLDVVRDGHPDVPIVVVSPVLRPDAEDEPNRLGATLADIRRAIESVTRDRIVDGDHTLALVAGESIIGVDHLGDGIHPDDEGHKRIAATVGKALALAMKAAEESPGAEVMKAAAKSLAEGRMARGRGDRGPDGIDGDGDGGPGRGVGRDAGPRGGRTAGRIRDHVKVGVGVGVGSGAGAHDGAADGVATSGAHRLDVAGGAVDEVAGGAVDEVIVTVDDAVADELEYSYGYEFVESDGDEDLAADEESESEQDDGRVVEARVAGTYVYEDYVDYENDVHYRYVEDEGRVEHEDEDEHENEAREPREDAEPEVHDLDAEVDGKRKGGGRKGRGVSTASSAR